MTIASLIVDVAANTAKLQTDVEQIHGKLDSVVGVAGKVASALGVAFSIQSVVSFANKIIDFSDRMKDLSQQTGIGVEALQKFDYVAIGAGTTVDVLAEAFAKLAVRLSTGDTSATKGMEMLHLNTKDWLALSPEQRIFAVADASSTLADENLRNAANYELFGRKFLELTPLMNDQLRKLAENAKFIDQEEVDLMAQFNDDLVQGERALMVWAAKAFDAAKMAFFMNENVVELDRETRRLNESSEAFIQTQVLLLDHFQKWGLQSKAVSMEQVELKILTEKLNDEVKASIKTHEDAEKAVLKHADALKKWSSDVQAAMADNAHAMIDWKARWEAVDEQIASVAMTVTEFNATLDGMTVVTMQNLDKQTFAWAEWTNAVHDDMAANEHSMMASTERSTTDMLEGWLGTFSNISDLFGQFGDTFEDILGPRFASAMQHFQDAARHGRGVVQGVLRGLSGDFTGWISAVMSGIALVRSAWQGLKELFGGGEEGVLVNPARDKFIAQYGGLDEMKTLMNQIGMDADLTESLTVALLKSDTMAKFGAAQDAIINLIGGEKFHSGGMVPGTGEVRATLLGGERVLSREQVRDESSLGTEVRGLRGDLARMLDQMQLQISASVQIARGRGNSHA